jgi:hypothetical protein
MRYVDVTVVNRSPETVHHHEHRAPTDDSVKLLIELQEKAEKRILEQIHIEDNKFNILGVFFGGLNPMGTITLRIRYSINGQFHTISHEISYFEWKSIDRYRRVQILYEQVAFHVAQLMFKESDLLTQLKESEFIL